MIPRRMQQRESKTDAVERYCLIKTVPMPDPTKHRSYLLQHTLLELALHLLTLLVRGRFAVQSHQSTEVELGLLEQLDLADVDLVRMSA
jgi:hypothetical protein